MNLVLKGIRVVDFTRVLSGPYCTAILADLGAEVIKIETPKTGDDVRFFGPFQNKESLYFMNVNRNKKSITLDLKKEEAKEIVAKLIEKSDVLVENFKPGVMDNLGFSYETVKGIKPDIIYSSISGYGQYGPYSKNAAYDLVIQALSGIMSMTGFPDKPPVRVATSITDLLSGMFSAIGIISALYYRSHQGTGQRIDIAMLDSAIAVLENAIFRYTVNGEIPARVGSRHSAGGPHNTYKTRDGYIALACGNESIWQRLTEVIQHGDLGTHPDFNSMAKRAKNIEFVDKIVEEWTAQRTTIDVLKDFNNNGIPCEPVKNIREVVEDPQVQARKMLQEVEHPVAGKVTLVGSPIKFSNATTDIRMSPPTLGQHNKEIICELLGFSEEVLLK